MTEFYVHFRADGETEERGKFIVHGCYPVKAVTSMSAAKKTISMALHEGYKRICIMDVYDDHFREIDKEEWDWRNHDDVL